MWGRFLYYFLQFKSLLVLSMAGMLVITFVLMLLMKGFSWNRRRHLLVITLFFQMPARYMVYLAANYIQFMFVLSTLFCSVQVQVSHLVFLVLLGLIQAVTIAQPAESIRSFIGSVMLYAAFLIVDLLKTYIFDMRFDWRIAFVCLLLCIFLIFYSVYFFINSIKCLASRHCETVRQAPLRVRRAAAEKDDIQIIDLDVVDIEEITENSGVINEEI